MITQNCRCTIYYTKMTNEYIKHKTKFKTYAPHDNHSVSMHKFICVSKDSQIPATITLLLLNTLWAS